MVMPREVEKRPIFSIANPNKAWVADQLEKLKSEWTAWLETVRNLQDSPDYDPRTCTEAIKDGHEIDESTQFCVRKHWCLSATILKDTTLFLRIGRAIHTKTTLVA
jgi:hypothetical protein